MIFNDSTLLHYMNEAPLALAFERALECRIYPHLPFERPILDLGCGDGLFARTLFREKIETGVDPDEHSIEEARNSGIYEEVLTCTGDGVPKPDGYYRTVFSNSVLEHIENIAPVFREVFRLLAPGGRFYFTVPSSSFCRYSFLNRALVLAGLDGLAEEYRRLYNNFWRHYHDYPREEWERRVKEAGFEVIASWNYGPQRIVTTNDLLVPFGILAYLSRRFTNRWILAPPLRRLIVRLLYPLAERWLRRGEKSEDGGLVFVAAGKAKR